MPDSMIEEAMVSERTLTSQGNKAAGDAQAMGSLGRRGDHRGGARGLCG